MENKSSSSGCLIAIVVVILLFVLLGSCGGESDYERAGREFNNWANSDPSGWSDTEKEYFNNFMDWADKN